MNIYTLYWIHQSDHLDPYIHGYIGITKREPQRRLNEHLKSKDFLPEDVHFTIIYQSNNEQEISDLEHEYRPESFIGWNKSPGGYEGGRPFGIHTSGWKWSEEAKAKLVRTGENNSRYGAKLSDEHKKSIGKAARKTHKGKPKNYKVVNPVMFGADNPRSRKIEGEGVVYNSIRECCRALGMKNHNAIRYRLKSDKTKWASWKYID